jgi:hypothetical protein
MEYAYIANNILNTQLLAWGAKKKSNIVGSGKDPLPAVLSAGSTGQLVTATAA